MCIGLMHGTNYELRKVTTTTNECTTFTELLALVGKSHLLIDKVTLNVGMMNGALTAPNGIWFSSFENVAYDKPIEHCAVKLQHDITFSSDDKSEPDTLLRQGTWLLYVDIKLKPKDDTAKRDEVFKQLRDMGFDNDLIESRYRLLPQEQLKNDVSYIVSRISVWGYIEPKPKDDTAKRDEVFKQLRDMGFDSDFIESRYRLLPQERLKNDVSYIISEIFPN